MIFFLYRLTNSLKRVSIPPNSDGTYFQRIWVINHVLYRWFATLIHVYDKIQFAPLNPSQKHRATNPGIHVCVLFMVHISQKIR